MNILNNSAGVFYNFYNFLKKMSTYLTVYIYRNFMLFEMILAIKIKTFK